LKIPHDRSLRKAFHECLAPIGPNNVSKCAEQRSRAGVEVPLGHGWVSFPLTPEKSLDVSPVFLQKSLGAILRVTLKMYEKALLFHLHERVDPALNRLCQYGITARGQRVRLYLIPARVGKTHTLRAPGSELVLAGLCKFKNTELFVTQRMPANAIAVQNARVRRQAGKNRGRGIALGPIENLRQDGPVGLVFQVRTLRFSAGHDH